MIMQHCTNVASRFPPLILLAGAVLLFGCASQPTTRDIISQYAEMKVELPETILVEIRPIESLECTGGFCTLSEADFLTHEADIDRLVNVKQHLELENQSRARAFNSMVDVATHEDIAFQKESESRAHLEQAIERERLGASLRQWLERAVFLLGVYVLSL